LLIVLLPLLLLLLVVMVLSVDLGPLCLVLA